MARLTPLQFEELRLHRAIYGDPLERIIATLKLGFAAVCNAWGGELEPDYFEAMAARRQDSEQAATGRQVEATLAPALGRPKRGRHARRSRHSIERPDNGV